jgi:exopolysaccharide biosynthesis polyprenyl glycosylphosphotransferase
MTDTGEAQETPAPADSRPRLLATVDTLASHGRGTGDLPVLDLGREGRLRFWRDALRRRMLAFSDVVTVGVAVGLTAPAAATFTWALLVLPFWVLVAKLTGLYDRDHRGLRHQTIDEVGAVVLWAAAGAAATALFIGITPAGAISFETTVALWFVAAALGLLFRAGTRLLWRMIVAPERTLVVGSGELAASVRRKAQLFPDMHLEVVEVVTEPGSVARMTLDNTLAEHDIDRVVVAEDRLDPELVGRFAETCHRAEVRLSVASPLRGRARPAQRLTQVADLPVLEFETGDISRSTVLIKRAFDITFAGFALVVALPLFPLIMLAIRLESRGPALFSQERGGLNGTPFRMYKFRTMVVDAEQRLREIVDFDQLDEPMFKLQGDPRVTKVGRWLRRFSLDELPQLINVVRGDMSVVGPRPEQMDLVHRYGPEHQFRLAVKPGLTGPMQAFGRGELTFAERMAVELDYIENMSLARDLRILLETVPAMLRGTGAF